MAVVDPPFIIPLSNAPSQTVTVTLNGQVCTINVYTKSIHRPIQDPGSIAVIPIMTGNFNGVLSGNVLTVSGATAGTIGVGYEVFSQDGSSTPALPSGLKVTKFLTGTGGNGTYEVFPGTVPVDAAGRYSPLATPPTISGPMTAYTASAPRYEQTNPVFADFYLLDAPILLGVHLRNSSLALMNQYLGIIGDFSLIDVTGKAEDPFGVPATLPNPPELRNAWQRSVPLRLEGKAPAAVANTIPGLGSRWLLTYWPNLK